MPVTTRSRTKAQAQGDRPPSPPPPRQAPAGPSRPKKGSPDSDDYTTAMCQEFIENPNKNPFTNAKIDFLGPRFMKLNEKCHRLANLSIDLNKYVEDKLNEDISLGYKMRNSLIEKVESTKTIRKMKNYFYDGKLTDIDKLPYLKHAYEFMNRGAYKTALDNYIVRFFENNKVRLLLFINEYLDAFIENKEDLTVKAHNQSFKLKINEETVRLILENAKENGIVPITEITFPRLYLYQSFIPNTQSTNIFINNYGIIRNTLVNKFINQEKPNKNELKKFIDGCKKLLDNNYLSRLQDKLDLEEIYNELETIYERLNKSKSKSISSPSTARESNKSASFSSERKHDLPPLENKKRDEILEDVLRHSKEERDMITLRDFKDMKKKDLQTVVRIGPKTGDNRQSTYSVTSIYKRIHNQVKSGLAPKDPLNPAHIITNDEMVDIHAKIQYYRRGAPRPDSLHQYRYPKVQVIFDEAGKWPTMSGGIMSFPGLYTIIIRHTIGTQSKDTYWGTIKYIDSAETGEPDLNTGSILETIRKLHDQGRLLRKDYSQNILRFVARVHINKTPSYWNEDAVRKLRLMKEELDSY